MATITQTAQGVISYDGYTKRKLTINASEWDIVFGYFRSITGDITIASNFATAVFTIAQDASISPNDILAQLKNTTNTLEMTQVLCFYLNTYREKFSLYGVTNILKPNEAVQRNVII